MFQIGETYNFHLNFVILMFSNKQLVTFQDKMFKVQVIHLKIYETVRMTIGYCLYTGVYYIGFLSLSKDMSRENLFLTCMLNSFT